MTKKYCYICSKKTINRLLRHNECAKKYDSFHYLSCPMLYCVNTGKPLKDKRKITDMWQCRIEYKD